MFKRALISTIALAALAVAPGAAAAATDTLVTPAADVTALAALDGTLVWSGGPWPHRTLMQRSPDGTVAPVAGAPAADYSSIDLGRDGAGELVLTYLRCGATTCKAYSDNLFGRRVSYKRLAPAGCRLTTAPARWGARVAYALSCSKPGKPNVRDRKRSGLFVRAGDAAPKRLRMPKGAAHMDVTRLDLRGTSVGAIVRGDADEDYWYTSSQTVTGAHARFAASPTNDGHAGVGGLSVGSGGALWSLIVDDNGEDPDDATVSRSSADGCARQRLANAPSEYDGYTPHAMAVDGRTLYIHYPSVGIIIHEFSPTTACS